MTMKCLLIVFICIEIRKCMYLKHLKHCFIRYPDTMMLQVNRDKSRLSLIVRVNVVLNKTVVVDSCTVGAVVLWVPDLPAV